jgi:hypothetical protein
LVYGTNDPYEAVRSYFLRDEGRAWKALGFEGPGSAVAFAFTHRRRMFPIIVTRTEDEFFARPFMPGGSDDGNGSDS